MIFFQSEATAARRRVWLYLVDATDGITPETGEAGGQPQVSKNGAAFANTTATLTAIANGSYYVEFTATELDTLGKVFLRYKSAATAEFSMVADVVALNVFDSVRAGLTALPNVASGSAGAIPTVGTGTAQVSLSGGAVTVGTNNDKTGYGLTTLESLVQHSGTAQAGAGSSITLAAGASATTDLYKGAAVKVYGGTGAGQTRVITAYNGSTKVATVSRAWATNPDSSSTYAVLALSNPALNTSLEVAASAVNGNVTGSVASVTGAVGSVTGAVGSVTGNVGGNVAGSVASVTGAVGSVTGAVGSVTGNVGGNVTGSVGSVASGGISTSSFASGAINAAAVATDAIGAAELAADAVAEIAAAILATPANLLDTDALGRVTVGANADKTDYQLTAQESGFAHTGTAQAGAGSSITLAAGASATTDLYKGAAVKVYSGTGAGQTRIISAYNGTTKVATVSRAWATNPDNTSLYAILTNDSPALDASLKVQGVVLTDTLTTYTGNTPQTGDAFARLGAPAGASVSADIAGVQSDTDNIQTRLPAALVSGRMAADAVAISGSTTAADAVEANIANLDATVSSRASQASVDTIDGIVDAILVDTNELQTDWANGGRLDNILDARASQASVDTIDGIVDAILIDTAEIGVAGAGLSAVPWNAAWDAEVQSEVNDALVVHRLDELLNADSDIDGAAPPVVGSVFHELMSKSTGSFTFDQTTDSLEALADTGGGGPTAADIADAVWDEALSGHLGSGSTGEALNAAGAAGDPWVTALPGAYGSGSAGFIVGTNLNATVSSRASQASVDTIDGNVDDILADTAVIGTPAGVSLAADVASVQSDTDNIQTRLPAALVSGRMAADAVAISGSTAAADAVEANIANLDAAISSRASQASVDTIDGIVDAILVDTAVIGTPAGASIAADVAAVQSDTDDIRTRLPAALVSGRIDASVGAMAANTLTASALATTAVDEIVDQVWDEALAGHAGAGAAGAALAAAGAAGDPWSAAVPGAYGAGTAGNILGTNLNATVSSRSSHAAADVWTVGSRTLTAFGFAVDVSAAAVTLIWAKATSALTTAGSIGKKLADWALGSDNRALVSADAHTSGETVAAVTGAVGSVTGAVGSVTGAVGSVTGNVGGNVTGSIGSLAAQAKADVNAEVVDTLAVDTYAEISSVPAAATNLAAMLRTIYAFTANYLDQTATVQRLRNRANTSTISTAAVDDDGVTATRASHS